MMKLKIKNIYADGYERFVSVETFDKKNITVHFIEYNEYLNQKEKPNPASHCLYGRGGPNACVPAPYRHGQGGDCEDRPED